jgi:hypothetical protein
MNGDLYPVVETAAVAISYGAGLVVSHFAERHYDNATPAPVTEWEAATNQGTDKLPRYTRWQKALGPVVLITAFGASAIPAWVPLHDQAPRVGQPTLEEVVDAGGYTSHDTMTDAKGNSTNVTAASAIRNLTIDVSGSPRYNVNISVANQGGFIPNVSLKQFKLNPKNSQYPTGEFSPSDADSMPDAVPPAISDAEHEATPTQTDGFGKAVKLESTAMFITTDDTELGPDDSVSTIVDEATADHVELFIANVGDKTDQNAADLQAEAKETGGAYIPVTGNIKATAQKIIKEIEPAKPAAESVPKSNVLKYLVDTMRFINILSLAGSVEAIRRTADWHMRKRKVTTSKGESV